MKAKKYKKYFPKKRTQNFAFFHIMAATVFLSVAAPCANASFTSAIQNLFFYQRIPYLNPYLPFFEGDTPAAVQLGGLVDVAISYEDGRVSALSASAGIELEAMGFSYDSTGRLVSYLEKALLGDRLVRLYYTSGKLTKMTWDDGANGSIEESSTFTWNPSGRVSTISRFYGDLDDFRHSFNFYYDSAGLLEKRSTIDNQNNTKDFFEYFYYPNGALKREKYEGRESTLEYDSEGKLISVSVSINGQILAVASVTYDSRSRPEKITVTGEPGEQSFAWLDAAITYNSDIRPVPVLSLFPTLLLGFLLGFAGYRGLIRTRTHK